MTKRIFLLFFLLSFFILPFEPAYAQSSGPVYIVQPGDTLSSIASRFKIPVNDLMTANSITNANLLAADQQLTIPGFEGMSGILNTEIVELGGSLRGVSRRDQEPVTMLQKLNHLISPSELYVSASLIVPEKDGVKKLTASAAPTQGETLLELAVRKNIDPWTLTTLNNLTGTWDALP